MNNNSIFAYLAYNDLEALAKSSRQKHRQVKEYLQSSWIRFLPHLPVHASILSQIQPGHILIHHNSSLLITGCLRTGTSRITRAHQVHINDHRILSAHTLQEKCFFLDSSNSFYEISTTAADVIARDVKLVSTGDFAYLQSDDWLQAQDALYKTPSHIATISCITFPWVGYEDGSLINLHHKRRTIPVNSAILCIITHPHIGVVCGHANGYISLNGSPKKISNAAAISALHVVQEVVLVGTANGVLHCYCLQSQSVEWATKFLDDSPIMQITTAECSILVSTFSRIVKVHYAPN